MERGEAGESESMHAICMEDLHGPGLDVMSFTSLLPGNSTL